MSLQPGEVVADCTFQRLDGTAARLSEFADRPLVLVFLRHLA
jgi:hypothetical protein